jgi:D-xylose transport system ATP-binding protein
VGSHPIADVTKDDILSLIIKGALPENWSPRNVN